MKLQKRVIFWVITVVALVSMFATSGAALASIPRMDSNVVVYPMATAPTLGAAESFAVLGAEAVTNTGSSVLTGDLGINPNNASSVTGFPPGTYTGAFYEADAVSLAAKNAAFAAYSSLDQACNQTFPGEPAELGGMTLTPGVYCFSSSAQLTGVLTLNMTGDDNAVFIFKIPSTLTTISGSSVVTINGGPPCNVFWRVGSSATIGTGTDFQGTIIAQDSITMTTGADMYGRALALTGAVTLDDNDITVPVCTMAEPGSLEIFKFNDLNGNGVYDPSAEVPLVDWHYTISGPSGYNSSGDTDEDGLLIKTDLVPGVYNVTETVKSGWIVTTANPQTGTVPVGGVKRLNFGNQLVPVAPGTLEIFKFNDLNGNGIYEPLLSESPLQSWNFTVEGGPTATPGPYSTDSNGLITISGLASGVYNVTETVKPGWTVTTANPQMGTVPVDGGKRLNFGNLEEPPVAPGTLEIFKFNDLNGNGVYDPPTESALSNWYYTITGPGGYSSDGYTGADGLITKTGLVPGAYIVTETVKPGWTVTTANPQTGTLYESSGKRLNFGNRQPSILQIFKFKDLNGNGVYDPPMETPQANWHYTITGPGGYSSSGDTDNLGLLTKTSLGGLVPGAYIVTETVKTGWTVTTGNPQTETVPAGGKILNFGNQQSAGVGGEATSVSVLGILAPWIMLVVIAGAAVWLWLSKRRGERET